MLIPRMIVRRCQISTNKKHIRDVFQPKMFAKRLYWAKVSQSKQQELIAVSAPGVFLHLLVDPYGKKEVGETQNNLEKDNSKRDDFGPSVMEGGPKGGSWRNTVWALCIPQHGKEWKVCQTIMGPSPNIKFGSSWLYSWVKRSSVRVFKNSTQ